MALPSRTLKLTIAYDGTAYHGWQVQPNGLTIQEELETTARRFTGEQQLMAGSGRTDAGVHAWGQVASWSYGGRLAPERIQGAFNSLLPADIRVRRVEEMGPAFHARKSARSKTYLYIIDNAPQANPFLRRYAWHIHQPLDLKALNQAAALLVGRHDFLSFKAADGKTLTSERTILQARWCRRGFSLFFFIKGNGFLKNMVRIIVGTLVDFGRGKSAPSEMSAIISARRRSAAGITAPAHGLILRSVAYAEDEMC
ncbi:MAG: tRNA pseudouridine(38-40) synthase TruA [Deltaproteobacteria bacterium]|nr:tRNA pseudouridine(38-40) synthase TruA [Deltaproteobacteria bacterium]